MFKSMKDVHLVYKDTKAILHQNVKLEINGNQHNAKIWKGVRARIELTMQKSGKELHNE